MAILNGTIQHRRGADKDFDASKMRPGEFSFTTDGSRKVRAAFGPGDVKELASKEEVEQAITEGVAAIKEKEQQALNNIGTGVDSSLTQEGKAADAGATGKAIDELKGDIVDYHYIEKDISGSVVIVDSNVINPVLSAKDNITVLHTGKNLVSVPYDDQTGSAYNVMFTIAENGMLHVNGTATGTAVHNFVKDNTANRRPIKAGTYTLSGCPAGGGSGIYMLAIGVTGVGEYNDYGDGITFTIPNDTTYYLKFKVYNGTTVDFDVKAQLEMSSGKTEWEQYKHENISVGSIPVSVSLYSGTNVFTADSVFNLSAKVKKEKKPIINLRDYATGDGETDDTNAINEALIKATNGILYVPSGTYLFSGTIHIYSGTKVIGCGENSVFKLSNDFELDAISWRPDTYNALYKYPMIALDDGSTGCELRNFVLIGQNTTWKDENEDGIMVQGSNHVIENLVIHNINYSNDNFASRWCLCPAWGINIFKANTVSVRNCHIYDCGYENIGTEESENITISDCRFGDACQTSSQIHRYSKHIKFYGNSVYHTENIRSSNCPAFTCDASIGVDMDDILVANNTFLSHVNTVAGGENNIRIIGNRIVGIMYTNTADNYASGLIISDNQIEGRINMRADNVIVTNNIINNDTEMPMARIYGNSVLINGNLGIGKGVSTKIVEH